MTILNLNIRQKIIAVSVILSLGLLFTRLIPISFYITYKFHIIAGFGCLAFILSTWALWEGISKLRVIVLMILPTLFTVAITGYYFLLPVRWLTRIPAALFFGFIFYFLLLSQNIFNISSVRTIPLYRVASTVAFVLTILTASLLFNVVFSLKLDFLWNGLAVFLVSLPLILQIIWSIELEGLPSFILVYSMILALIVGELAIALSFWPISLGMASVVLTSVLYITLGIGSDHLRERLNRGVIIEYVAVGVLVFVVAFLLFLMFRKQLLFFHFINECVIKCYKNSIFYIYIRF